LLIAQTVAIEPYATKELSQELNALKLSYQEEMDSVLEEMVRLIRLHSEQLISAFVIVTKIDILYAKILLADQIGGVIPIVGDNGTISCYDAKHPLLLLKENDISRKEKISAVVGNDIELNGTSSTLIISGPNAGGKTIVLKTCGLLGVMVNYGIPIPVRQGSRFDVFDNIMADIGDSQSVIDEVSSYTGHLVACRDIINVVREAQKGNNCSPVSNPENGRKTVESNHSLVLIDEIGRGTDPTHGSVLAESIIEDLSSSNARTILSTHYPRIKKLGFLKHQIGGMEFMNNKPTFRLKSGYVSESYPLELAYRLGFPSNILEKAADLLEDEERCTVELQEKMRKQYLHLYSLEKEYKKKIQELEEEKRKTTEINALLNEQMQKLRSSKRREFYQDVTDMEQDLASLVDLADDCVMKLQQEAQSAKKKGRDAADAFLKMKNSTLISVSEIYRRFQEIKEKTKLEIIDRGLKEFNAVLVNNTHPFENHSCFVILEPGAYYGCRGQLIKREIGQGDGDSFVNLCLENGDHVLIHSTFVARCEENTNSCPSLHYSRPPSRRKFSVEYDTPDVREETIETFLPICDIHLDSTATTNSALESIENLLLGASAGTVTIFHGKHHPLKTWLRSWLLYHPAVETVAKGEPLDGFGDNLTILTLKSERV
jgi:dsDNA-specific endonuclease/ATPase MutS2